MISTKHWRGVRWEPIVGGRCTKHRTPVGAFTKLCYSCHQEQLEAARQGSREWERKP